MEFYCFNKYTVIVFILLWIALIGLLVYGIYTGQLFKSSPPYPKEAATVYPNRSNSPGLILDTEEVIALRPPIGDRVRDYDYRKMYDPLEEPTKRVDRHEILPIGLRKFFDYPTQGFPDSYRQMGILVNNDDETNPNRILRLLGRQEYPGSNRYEYYTSVTSGNDMVKIEVRGKRKGREIYDGDEITIPEINSKYTVSIYGYDEPRYYP